MSDYEGGLERIYPEEQRRQGVREEGSLPKKRWERTAGYVQTLACVDISFEKCYPLVSLFVAERSTTLEASVNGAAKTHTILWRALMLLDA